MYLLLSSRYPRDAPLVCFSTPASQFPKSASLNVTKRLMEEARAMALDQAPCVHTLVSLLEARSTVEDAARAEPSAFSYDEELVPKSALQVQLLIPLSGTRHI